MPVSEKTCESILCSNTILSTRKGGMPKRFCSKKCQQQHWHSEKYTPSIKTCPKCGTEFHGRTNQKFCSDACRTNDWSAKNRGKINKYNATNKVNSMYSRLKSRAKASNIPFNIEKTDLVIPTHCPVLGIELVWGEGKGYQPYSPSVDKIKPNLGYVKGNVRVISARANLLKNDATIEELEKVLEDARACL